MARKIKQNPKWYKFRGPTLWHYRLRVLTNGYFWGYGFQILRQIEGLGTHALPYSG